MRYLTFLLFMSFFILPAFSSAQLTGCYSVPTSGGLGRFYYQRISGNNYSASTYATSGTVANCASFTAINVTSTPCQVANTSTNYLFITTANVPISCLPIDDYVWLFLPSTIVYILVFRRRKAHFGSVFS